MTGRARTRRPAILGAAGLALAALAAASCRRASEPPEATAPVIAPPVARPAADLPLHRGHVVLTTEASRFLPCDGGRLELADETGGLLARAYDRLASSSTGEMFVAVRGEIAGSRLAARLLVQAAMPGEGGSCPDRLPAGHVLARGQEPSWSVLVTDEALTLTFPGEEPLVFPATPATPGTPGRTWTASRPDAPADQLILAVAPFACWDPMSGAFDSLAAELTFRDRVLQGCARDGG